MGELKKSVTIIGLKGKKRVLALFDSGATENFVSLKLAKELAMYKYEDFYFTVADGRKKKGYLTSAIIEIMRRDGETKLVVTDALPQDGYNIILGQRFLQDNEVILNFKKDKVRYSKYQPYNRRIGRL